MKLGLIALGLTIATVFVACPAPAATTTFKTTLAGTSEVPPNTSLGTGSVTVTLNEGTKQITVDGTYSALSSVVAAPYAHIHGPAPVGTNAPVIFSLTYDAATSGKLGGTFTLTDAQITDLKAGNYYVNVHTTNFINGEVRGQLQKQ
jgi:CHRD domain